MTVGRIFLDALPIDSVSCESIPSVLIKMASDKKRRPFFITYLNAYHFNLAQKNKKYCQVLKKADLVYADGWGVVLAARFFGYKLPGRLTAKDFFDEFCREVEKEKMSLFLLGGEKRVVKKMAKTLKCKFPRLRIKGWRDGYVNHSEEKSISARINQLQPDFLIVNMGSPKQELWLARNIGHLKIKVGWCVGGLFDFVAGKTPSCPKWLGDLGFEWLFRLLVEPKRLWRRYIIGLPLFIIHILKIDLLKRK